MGCSRGLFLPTEKLLAPPHREFLCVINERVPNRAICFSNEGRRNADWNLQELRA